MPSPHDCPAIGHGTSPGPGFPAQHRGIGDDGYVKEIHVGSASSCPYPRTTWHTHDMNGLSRCPNPPQIRPPPGGEADSDGQNPDAGRSNRSNPRSTTRLRYPRPPTSSGVRWATCRWLLSGRSVDPAQPYVESATRVRRGGRTAAAAGHVGDLRESSKMDFFF
jgi:hypothetical protein